MYIPSAVSLTCVVRSCAPSREVEDRAHLTRQAVARPPPGVFALLAQTSSSSSSSSSGSSTGELARVVDHAPDEVQPSSEDAMERVDAARAPYPRAGHERRL